jgi:hypothetical protein
MEPLKLFSLRSFSPNIYQLIIANKLFLNCISVPMFFYKIKNKKKFFFIFYYSILVHLVKHLPHPQTVFMWDVISHMNHRSIVNCQ